MEKSYKEIWARFPEVHSRLEHEDPSLPYNVMGTLAWWLKELQPSDMTLALVERVVDFVEWCKNQPSGKTAADDIYTILTVAFLEELFESDGTRTLIPKLIPK